MILPNGFNSLEQAYLTPPEPSEADEENQTRREAAEGAAYFLEQCVSNLMNIGETDLADELASFIDPIGDLKEEQYDNQR